MKKFSTKIAALVLAVLLTTATSISFANSAYSNSANGHGVPASNTNTGNISASSPNSSASISVTGTNSTGFNTKHILSFFHRVFRNAEILSSAVESKFIVVTFKENDMVQSAYYAENGQLLAIVHNIVSSQLPTSLQEDLKNNYNGYWITELFEIREDGQNSGYYMALENADTKLTLRSTVDGDWEVFSSVTKL